MEHMARIAASGVPVVPLQEVQSKPGSVAITFDFGFRNFLDFGLPILEQYEFPATVFIVSGYCGDRNRWHRRDRDIPKLPLMGWDELAALPKTRITLGAQTVTYPLLPTLDRAAVATELDSCRQAIQHVTGSEPVAFCYPFGATSPLVREMVAERFQVACTDRLDYVVPDSNPLQLPRIDAFALKDPAVLSDTIRGSRQWQLGLRRMFREVRSRLRIA